MTVQVTRFGLDGLILILGIAFVFGAVLRTRSSCGYEPIEQGVMVLRPGDEASPEDEPVIRQRFREPVQAALTRRGYSPNEAETAITEGTWTNNEEAAEYLRPGRS